MPDWMVAFRVEVPDEASPVDAVRAARDKVDTVWARVWLVPDDLDDEPQYYEVTPEGEVIGARPDPGG